MTEGLWLSDDELQPFKMLLVSVTLLEYTGHSCDITNIP